MFRVPEIFRVRTGVLRSDESFGNNGLFELPPDGTLRAIASDGDDWEHVSISLLSRVPTWEEMCDVKNLFWDAEDVVIQYHPPKSEYVNCHPHTLHLWRKFGTNDFCERPPSHLIGPKND